MGWRRQQVAEYTVARYIYILITRVFSTFRSLAWALHNFRRWIIFISPDRANRIPTRSGGVLFALSGLIFSIMTGVLYIIPYVFNRETELVHQRNYEPISHWMMLMNTLSVVMYRTSNTMTWLEFYVVKSEFCIMSSFQSTRLIACSHRRRRLLLNGCDAVGILYNFSPPVEYRFWQPYTQQPDILMLETFFDPLLNSC